jgi:Methyltransferase domain
LLRSMPKRSVCAEIGVYEGEYSEQILAIVEPRRLHLIDPWKYEEGDRYRQAGYGDLGSGGQATMDERHRKVKERFTEEIRVGTVHIHRKDSSSAVDDFRDSYFDWVYIDGNHLYEFVRRDLQLYYRKLKTGGYITGDDYGVEGWWENGVQRAVDEFVCGRPDLTLEVVGNQFIISKSA